MNRYSGTGIRTSVRFLAAAILLSGLLPYRAGAAPANPGTTTPVGEQRLSPEETKARQDWHESMKHLPPPKKGCFQATYPDKQWHELQCIKPPPNPGNPSHGSRPGLVGRSGGDVSAKAPNGLISSATGSFTVSGVTSESSPIGNSGPPVTDAYMLQINTNTFQSATACAGGAAGCLAWEQFFFTNNGSAGAIYMQYWLIGYGTCPNGQNWNQLGSDCYKNSTNGTAVPNQPIANLGNLVMTANLSTAADTLYFWTGAGPGMMYMVTGDNVVGAAASWQIAEFNVFGLFNDSQASFNNGAAITPRNQIIYGGSAAPLCDTESFTGETNNLSFGPMAPAPSPPGPALIFEESSAGGALSNCAAAASIGDTHLRTNAGLFYDFQAAGDFVLLRSDADFMVQTRQVSGAPTWPNADVNHAVATQMGRSRVAVCLAPNRLSVDGQITDLADGNSLVTADGVKIMRHGNHYSIISESGDSVIAEVNATWINVSVGLGHWPATISGLLANPNGNVNQLGLRNGTALSVPYGFQDLYGGYADSWRVKPEESLLAVCGEREPEHGIAAKPFYAADLPPAVAERTRAVCTAAGVKPGALLDACTLDVAVIGDNQASKVFINAPEPPAVGQFTSSPGSNPPALFTKWWWLLFLVIVILLILLLKMRK